MKEIKCIELFAGVGGFRVGIEKHNTDNFKFNTIWSNQWEPSTKIQHASNIYKLRFGSTGHVNKDISTIDAKNIPNHDLLCGGFPCQDYSVASILKNSNGINGKKGVLWWEIHRIIKEKKTPYLILENVDRIVISPSKQRGRDFSIILKSLMDLDYIVEWRIINAAEYGMPQKRKRTYFLVYKKNSELGKKMLKDFDIKNMFLNKDFEIEKINDVDIIETDLSNNIKDISDNFNLKNNMKTRAYWNCGLAFNNKVYSLKVKSKYNGLFRTINDILLDEKDISNEFYIKNTEISKWENYKYAKSVPRVNKKTGFKYNYVQGNMDFPDKTNKASRTIITSEGGRTASRTTHAIKVNGRIRRLHPIEIERLNGFKDNHTQEVSNTKRGFLMGNALMVEIITIISGIIKKNK